MKNNIEKYEEVVFEKIKHIDEFGNEYWEARELQKVLEYSKWDKFLNVIDKAKTACENSKNIINDHFLQVGKIVKAGATTKEKIDINLSRYACYLIVQNADSNKEVVALGQTYFAIQTRKQEISEMEYSGLSELEKRYYNRDIARKGNYQLNRVALKAGVKNFDKFHNAGYKGLYGGETADDIAKRKNLRYREDILDNMGSDELAANIFRISQTKQKIENEKIAGEDNANNTHYKVGKNVRSFIKRNSGTLSENMDTPKRSLKVKNVNIKDKTE